MDEKLLQIEDRYEKLAARMESPPPFEGTHVGQERYTSGFVE